MTIVFAFEALSLQPDINLFSLMVQFLFYRHISAVSCCVDW